MFYEEKIVDGVTYSRTKPDGEWTRKLTQLERELVEVLERGIEHAGFSLSGPTDHRAAEDGEPAWVCNARGVIAEATRALP